MPYSEGKFVSVGDPGGRRLSEAEILRGAAQVWQGMEPEDREDILAGRGVAGWLVDLAEKREA